MIDQFEAGDVGYAPMGAGHYIKNTGSDVCRVLVGFNSPHYQAMDLSEWLAGNPLDVLETNLGLSPEVAAKTSAQDGVYCACRQRNSWFVGRSECGQEPAK